MAGAEKYQSAGEAKGDIKPTGMEAGGEGMKLNQMLQISGGAAFLGGVLEIAARLINFPWSNDGQESLYLVIDLLFLYGLLGLFSAHIERWGLLGFMGFIIALSGVASLVGPDGKLYGMDLYVLGGAAFAIGLAVMSMVLLRRGVFLLGAPLAWVGALCLGIMGAIIPQMPVLDHLSGVSFGFGFILAGFTLLR